MKYKFKNFAYWQDMLVYGWSLPEEEFVWSEGERSLLHISTLATRCLNLRIHLASFLGGGRSCEFYLFVNGTDCGSFVSPSHNHAIEVQNVNNTLPPGCGIFIDFYHLSPISPRACGEGPDNRRLNIALRSIEVEAREESIDLEESQRPSIDALRGSQVASIKESLWLSQQLRDTSLRSSGNVALERMLSGYIRGFGGNKHDRGPFRRKLTELHQARGLADALFLSERLSKAAIAKILPEAEEFILDDKPAPHVEKTAILAKADNALFDPEFASPWQKHVRTWFGVEKIPEESVFASPAVDLVVNSRRYMIISRDGRSSVSQCNHADLSALSVPLNILQLSKPIVLLQDQFDCGNIAHFLFDSVVRLLHWCGCFPKQRAKAVFVLGGVPSEFHKIIISAVARIVGVHESQFWFPVGEMRLRSSSDIYWFESQLHSQHPSNVMRAESVSMLQSLALGVVGTIGQPARSFPERIYISRKDATVRRPQNEAEIVKMLNALGFQILVMSQMSWRDQIEVVANARMIVAPHGMGLTHLAFNILKPRVIELFNPNLFSDAYALLARAFGDDYVRIIGKEVDLAHKNFHVDLELLRSLI